MRKKFVAAFTLIELLVVIAIIAVLASIALPVYWTIVERGRAVADSNNLKQIGLAAALYHNDNNDTIFSSTTTAQDSAGNTLFAPGLLQIQYASNPKVFHSPFDRRADRTTGPAIVSYGVNANILNRPANPGPNDFNGDWAKLSSASQLVFMAPNIDPSDASTVAFQPLDASSPTPLNVPTPAVSKADYRGTQGNRSKISVLYADGHVAISVPYREYSTSTGTDDDKRRWQPFLP
jgi:prepilin-type N-terminal cleavage/methylation domain-containing protein/prepilin-type processing-associated H-X9-DG protein